MEVFRNEPVVLCHGDVHAGNWLPDRASRLWLVDWEAARFRVAASDFNQLHWHWLDRKSQDLLLGHYAHISGRDLRPLYAQVGVTRLLWHLRTYNFYTLVQGEAPGAHAAHLDHAAGLLSDIAHQRAG